MGECGTDVFHSLSFMFCRLSIIQVVALIVFMCVQSASSSSSVYPALCFRCDIVCNQALHSVFNTLPMIMLALIHTSRDLSIPSSFTIRAFISALSWYFRSTSASSAPAQFADRQCVLHNHPSVHSTTVTNVSLWWCLKGRGSRIGPVGDQGQVWGACQLICQLCNDG